MDCSHAVAQRIDLTRLRVIASAGSDAKVEYMRSLGADVAFNYRSTDVAEALKKHGPLVSSSAVLYSSFLQSPQDIYWDNVGGASVEAAIEHAHAKARFIVHLPLLRFISARLMNLLQMCGSISEYNTEPHTWYGVKVLPLTVCFSDPQSTPFAPEHEHDL